MKDSIKVWDALSNASTKHRKAFDHFTSCFNEVRAVLMGQNQQLKGIEVSEKIDCNGFVVEFVGRKFRFEYRFSLQHHERSFVASITCYEILGEEAKDRVQVYSVAFKENGETDLFDDSEPVYLNSTSGPAYIVLSCISKAI